MAVDVAGVETRRSGVEGAQSGDGAGDTDELDIRGQEEQLIDDAADHGLRVPLLRRRRWQLREVALGDAHGADVDGLRPFNRALPADGELRGAAADVQDGAIE